MDYVKIKLSSGTLLYNLEQGWLKEFKGAYSTEVYNLESIFSKIPLKDLWRKKNLVAAVDYSIGKKHRDLSSIRDQFMRLNQQNNFYSSTKLVNFFHFIANIGKAFYHPDTLIKYD